MKQRVEGGVPRVAGCAWGWGGVSNARGGHGHEAVERAEYLVVRGVVRNLLEYDCKAHALGRDEDRNEGGRKCRGGTCRGPRFRDVVVVRAQLGG